MLFEKDSAQDLICRGFTVPDVCSMTGLDSSSVRSMIRSELSGIDRKAYQYAFIDTHIGRDGFLVIFDDYNHSKIDRFGFLAACGLGLNSMHYPTYQSVKAICDHFGVVPDRKAANTGLHLFDKDSALDLLARGMSKLDVCARTGVPMSKVSAMVQMELAGVDRKAYQQMWVAANVSRDDFCKILSDYGDGKLDKPGFFVACGLGATVGRAKIWQSIRGLCERMNVMDEFQAAYKKVRQGTFVKAQVTMMERYGVDKTSDIPGVREKSLVTMRDKYGVDYTFQSDAIRAKGRATMIERYGAKTTLESDILRSKFNATMRERYDVDWSMQSALIRDKTSQACKARYDVDWPSQRLDVKAQREETLMAHYGVRVPSKSPVIQERIEQTCFDKYGARCVLMNPDIAAKCRATMMARYGVEHVSQSEELHQRSRDAIFKKYGVTSASLIPGVRDKIRETMISRYGVAYGWQNEEIYAKFLWTMHARYGVEYAAQSQVFRGKMYKTMEDRCTWNHSSAEDYLYDKLVSVFGSDDIFREYRTDSRYPYRCDFYVKSRDMFVEMNGYFSHWHHWYGSDVSDLAVLDEFSGREGGRYRSFEQVWPDSDVKKREAARSHNLNYIVFWDGARWSDVDLWFAMGCPDGHDWEREYSWLPDRDLSYTGSFPEKLTLSDKTVFPAVLAAQWREFYKNELDFWSGRFDSKWGTVQARLYANRCKYIGKKPDELTNSEILRGLTISGMVRGYSHFQFGGLLEFLNKYSIKSVYDPCAGWGERMLVFSQFNIAYLGVDINANLFDGYCNLIDQYGLDQTSVICGDSSKLDLSHAHHDCVFTCPPYESKEIYTEYGAENFSHDAFIAWWEQVVKHAVCDNTRIFAYQIDQACKSDMNEVLLNFGWHLDMQIPVAVNKTSHMVRSKGVKKKKNFEEIQVFVRDI